MTASKYTGNIVIFIVDKREGIARESRVSMTPNLAMQGKRRWAEGRGRRPRVQESKM